MKKTIFVILLMLYSAFIFSQYNWNYSDVLSQERHISSLSFVNADKGFALLYENNNTVTLYKSTNKGIN